MPTTPVDTEALRVLLLHCEGVLLGHEYNMAHPRREWQPGERKQREDEIEILALACIVARQGLEDGE